jgi:hypothetical protein
MDPQHYFRLKIVTLCKGDYDRYNGTDPIVTTLNPDWRSFRLKIGTLCNGDYDRYLYWNGAHSHHSQPKLEIL